LKYVYVSKFEFFRHGLYRVLQRFTSDLEVTSYRSISFYGQDYRSTTLNTLCCYWRLENAKTNTLQAILEEIQISYPQGQVLIMKCAHKGDMEGKQEKKNQDIICVQTTKMMLV
jgi:hypothetical protein